MIKLLILDIDGVMTDGTKMYDLDGNVFGKKYNDKDFTAIKRFIASGVKVCFLSGDVNVNEAMAKKRNIDFYYSRGSNGIIDKAAFIPIFEEKYNVTADEMAYVGDDYFDLSIINKLFYTYCPSDSPLCVKDAVNVVLSPKAGDAVIANLYDLLTSFGTIKEASDEDINILDKNEKL